GEPRDLTDVVRCGQPRGQPRGELQLRAQVSDLARRGHISGALVGAVVTQGLGAPLALALTGGPALRARGRRDGRLGHLVALIGSTTRNLDASPPPIDTFPRLRGRAAGPRRIPR